MEKVLEAYSNLPQFDESWRGSYNFPLIMGTLIFTLFALVPGVLILTLYIHREISPKIEVYCEEIKYNGTIHLSCYSGGFNAIASTSGLQSNSGNVNFTVNTNVSSSNSADFNLTNSGDLNSTVNTNDSQSGLGNFTFTGNTYVSAPPNLDLGMNPMVYLAVIFTLCMVSATTTSALIAGLFMKEANYLLPFLTAVIVCGLCVLSILLVRSIFACKLGLKEHVGLAVLFFFVLADIYFLVSSLYIVLSKIKSAAPSVNLGLTAIFYEPVSDRVSVSLV